MCGGGLLAEIALANLLRHEWHDNTKEQICTKPLLMDVQRRGMGTHHTHTRVTEVTNRNGVYYTPVMHLARNRMHLE